MHQVGLSDRVTDSNNGWVRASPDSVVYSIVLEAALLTLNVNVVASVVKARLRPIGVAKRGFVYNKPRFYVEYTAKANRNCGFLTDVEPPISNK